MSSLLTSLKADLLGRRMLPLLVLLGVALTGALAYALLAGSGGSGSSGPAASLTSTAPTPPPAIATPAPSNPNAAVSEMTTGTHYQRGGHAHDPFTPLPEAKTKQASSTPGGASSTPANSSSSSTSTTAKGGTGSGTSGGTTPSGSGHTEEAHKKKVMQRSYAVALLFGLAPPPGQNPQLTPYENVKRLTPLPDKEHAQLIYSGVSPSGKGAVFTLLHEAIVSGEGICLPSATQCEMLDMPVGKVEQLQYLGPEGQTLTYLLQVTSIVKHEVVFTHLGAHVSQAGRKLLRAAGLPASRLLRYLPGRDVVLFSAHPFSAHR